MLCKYVVWLIQGRADALYSNRLFAGPFHNGSCVVGLRHGLVDLFLKGRQVLRRGVQLRLEPGALLVDLLL